MFEFLEPIPDRPDQQIATDPGRLAVVKSMPSRRNGFEAERPDAVDLGLERLAIG